MATDLERLVVSLSADIKSYERSLAKAQGVTTSALRKIESDAQKRMGNFEKIMGRAGSALSGFGKGLVIGGIATAVAGIEELIRGSITSAAAIGDLSDKLGISSDKLQELQYGAVQANLSFEGLEGGLLKFNKALAQAQNGSGDLLKTLEANGFTKAQIKALSYSEALDVVADLIKNARTEQDAFLITTQAFGKGNDEFAEFLRSGSDGLKTFATDAKNSGAIIEESLIKSAQAFDDAWAAALLSVKSKIGEFVLSAIPVIQRIDSAVSDAADRLGLALGTLTPESIAARNPVPIVPQTVNSSGKGNRTTKVFDPEVDADGKKGQSLADQRARNIQRQIGDLKSLFAAVDASNVQQEVATQLSRYDVDAKSADGKAIADLVEKTMMHKAVLETVAFAAQQAAEKQEAFADSEIALAESGVSAFQQWAIEGDKLSDVIANLAKSLADAAIQASLFGSGPLAGLFGTGASGGFFGNLFKPPGLYGDGGSIKSGEYGWVGERGVPELVKGPATVIPMNRMGGGATQNITFAPQIDARGADAGAIAKLTNDLRAMSRDFAKNVKNVVTKEKSMNSRFGT